MNRINSRPSRGRRFLAGIIDLYHTFYIALPLIIVGILLFLILEMSMINSELDKAQKRPSGKWMVDRQREKQLARERKKLKREVLRSLAGIFKNFPDPRWKEKWKKLTGKLKSKLGKALMNYENFKKSFDSLKKSPVTKALIDTALTGFETLQTFLTGWRYKRYVKPVQQLLIKEAKERLRILGKKLSSIKRYFRMEFNYRLDQIAGYLGLRDIMKTIRKRGGGKSAHPVKSGSRGKKPILVRLATLIDKFYARSKQISSGSCRNFMFLKLFAGLALLLAIGYVIFRDSINRGQSFGKRYAGIRVIDEGTRQPPKLSAAMIRGALLICLLPVEIILSSIRQDGKRLGDLAANTIVVIDEDGNKLKGTERD